MRSTNKPLLAALCLFCFAHPTSAQGRDLISGTWVGYIGRTEATPAAVTFKAKSAPGGKVVGSLSGPKLMPGDVKEGSFDAATGTLKLTVLVRPTSEDKGGEVSFEGWLLNDTIAGTMVLNGEKGVFKWTRESVVDVVVRKEDPATAAAKRGFVEVSGWITAAAELVPADKYSYRPASTVRTYGQLVAHVVDGYRYYCGRAAGRKVEWTDAAEKGVTTKAAVTQALKQATADCSAAYASGKEIAPMMENVGHSSLHYGNMITYIRMLGMTPPSS